MGLKQRFEEHWLIALLIICSVVAVAAWGVADQLLVRPRDFEIESLKREVALLRTKLKEKPPAESLIPNPNPRSTTQIVLPETGVFEKSSITTNDGVCLIAIKSVSVFGVDLSVTLGSGEAEQFESIKPGKRVAVKKESVVYYVDVHRIRGNIVDLSASAEIIAPR